jgi:outer membrane lipoprotein LolB
MSRRAWCACVVLLSGCASVGPIDQERANAHWTARRAQLEQISHFTVQGRASVSGPTSGTANLIWHQAPEEFDMHLAGPLGVGAMSLAGDSHEVRVRAKNRSFVTNDPEGSLRENLGWALPLAGLRYWILSLPSPKSDFDVKLDASGLPQTLTQDGWALSYTDYVETQKIELPRRIVLSRDDVKIRVIVDAWSDLPAR